MMTHRLARMGAQRMLCSHSTVLPEDALHRGRAQSSEHMRIPRLQLHRASELS